jgi:hypothetical protein
MAECPKFERAESGDLTELLQRHAANMARANVCKARHSALVKLLRELRDENEE